MVSITNALTIIESYFNNYSYGHIHSYTCLYFAIFKLLIIEVCFANINDSLQSFV